MNPRIGPTASLALALFHKWEAERPFVIVTAYIDESGTHGPPIMLMGCLVGDVNGWNGFDFDWRKHLAQNHLTYYHSKKMKHSQGEFRGWKAHQKLAFRQRAAQITEQHTMFGVTTVLSYADYNKFYIADERPPEIQLDSKYGLCFRFCLLRIVDVLRYRLGDPDDLQLYFVLESGHENFGDAHRIFNDIKQKGTRDLRLVLKTIIPGDKKDYFGLQGADGGAYHILGSERGRAKLPGTIRIPMPQKNVRAAPSPWQHYNFIISPEKLTEFKSAIMREVERKRARRKPLLGRVRNLLKPERD